MTARRLPAALLLAAVPAAVATAAAVLKAGNWSLFVDRHRIELTPKARRSCSRCHGDGGCWSDRRELRIWLLPIPAWRDEPPF